MKKRKLCRLSQYIEAIFETSFFFLSSKKEKKRYPSSGWDGKKKRRITKTKKIYSAMGFTSPDRNAKPMHASSS